MKRRQSIITAAMLLTVPGVFACNPDNDARDTTAAERPAVSSPSETLPPPADPTASSQPGVPSEPNAYPDAGTAAESDASGLDVASYERRLDEVRENLRELEQRGDAGVTGDVEPRIDEVAQMLTEVRQEPSADHSARLEAVDRTLDQIEQELQARL